MVLDKKVIYTGRKNAKTVLESWKFENQNFPSSIPTSSDFSKSQCVRLFSNSLCQKKSGHIRKGTLKSPFFISINLYDLSVNKRAKKLFFLHWNTSIKYFQIQERLSYFLNNLILTTKIIQGPPWQSVYFGVKILSRKKVHRIIYPMDFVFPEKHISFAKTSFSRF